ncbi:MAG: short chain dehydrogenase, partial [Halomonadaceae bacterium]
MSDLYLKFANSPLGKQAVSSLGLPAPQPLERWQRSDQPFIEGDVLLGAGPAPRALATLADILKQSAATLYYPKGSDQLAASGELAQSHKAKVLDLTAEEAPKQSFKALVLDATGIKDTTELRCLYDFYHPTIRNLARNGRVLVIGMDPVHCKQPA